MGSVDYVDCVGHVNCVNFVYVDCVNCVPHLSPPPPLANNAHPSLCDLWEKPDTLMERSMCKQSHPTHNINI